MKSNYTRATFALLLLLKIGTATAQVSITTDNSAPDPKAMLDIKANDKGLLIPRMTTAERNTLAATLTNAQKGMMVFDSQTASFWYFDGAAFNEVGKSMTAGTGISISGTTITDPSNDLAAGRKIYHFVED